MRRFAALAPVFERYGVRVIAISRDEVGEAERMHRDEQLGEITLLADPELAVIRRFGLVHERAIVFGSAFMRLFGLPVGLPRGVEAMAVPTTLLIDEAGIVRWVDQAEDYRLRSDAARVEAALREVWGDLPN